MTSTDSPTRPSAPRTPCRWTPCARATRWWWRSTSRASTRPRSTSRSSATYTVAAERRWARSEDEQVLAAERRHGSLRRQLVLGDNLDGSRIDAAYQDGVLVLSIPVAETAKPRKVAVAAGNGAPAIEAEATEAAAG
ncbi:MAG: Hsp20 family protein [Acidimicrobiales bacterium]